MSNEHEKVNHSDKGKNLSIFDDLLYMTFLPVNAASWFWDCMDQHSALYKTVAWCRFNCCMCQI